MGEEAAGVMYGPGQAESAKQQIGGGGGLRMLRPAHAHKPSLSGSLLRSANRPPKVRGAQPTCSVQ